MRPVAFVQSRWWQIAFIAIVAIAAGLLALPARDRSANDLAVVGAPQPVAPSDFSRLVDAGDHRLHVSCRGSGSPTIFLEAGYGMSLSQWGDVLPGIADHARVCAYDRLDLGLSSEGDGTPRSPEDVLADLEFALAGAQIDEPFVMVGFSIGGLICRLYAGAHPQQVSGLVLVDPTPSEWPAQSIEEAAPPLRKSLVLRLSGFDEREPEQIDVLALAEHVQRTTAGRIVPTYVITAGIRAPNIAGYGAEQLASTLRELQQRQIEELDAEEIVALHSTHSIPADAPELVVETVLRVIAEIQLQQARTD